LLYLNTTRPDITFVTQQLSQFLAKPTVTHYNAATRVLKYLKNNPGRGLFFHGILLYISQDFLMLIGRVALILDDLFQANASFLANLSSLGVPKSN
jgi:hypothetical protein